MTIAVCLRCGEFKQGGLAACPKCGYTPDDDESMIKHLLITDKHLSREQLEKASAMVKNGMQFGLPITPEMLETGWDDPTASERVGQWVLKIKERAIGAGFLLLIFALMVLVWAIGQRL